MARVTVEDCILNIPNRFDLVISAAHRAKQIASGNPLTVERDNDKDAVVALREVADRTIDLDGVREEVIQNFCRRQVYEAPEAAVEEVSADVEDAFEDAKQHIEVTSGARSYGGLSFVEDNIEAED